MLIYDRDSRFGYVCGIAVTMVKKKIKKNERQKKKKKINNMKVNILWNFFKFIV